MYIYIYVCVDAPGGERWDVCGYVCECRWVCMYVGVCIYIYVEGEREVGICV